MMFLLVILGDFVINWDAIKLNLTFFNGDPLVSGEVIPSGDVNFSKLCRDNETLGNIKGYLNTIIGFSFLFMLLFEYYKILLYCLGVSSELVNLADHVEEDTVTEVTTDSYYDSYNESKSKVVGGVRKTDSRGFSTTKTTTRRHKL